MYPSVLDISINYTLDGHDRRSIDLSAKFNTLQSSRNMENSWKCRQYWNSYKLMKSQPTLYVETQPFFRRSHIYTTHTHALVNMGGSVV